MTTSTAKWIVPGVSASDAVSTAAVTTQNMAARLDLLLGEWGTIVVSPAANVLSSTAVVLSRSYPGNPAGTHPGDVVLNWNQALAPSAALANMWITNWTGVAGAITGFTINFQCTAAQASRNILWRYLPVAS